MRKVIWLADKGADFINDTQFSQYMQRLADKVKGEAIWIGNQIGILGDEQTLNRIMKIKY